MFLVPAGTEGFTVSRKLDKIGWLCSEGMCAGRRAR